MALPRELFVVRRRRQSLDGRVVQTEIEDRYHKSGHRHAGAGADGDQERPLGIAEAGLRDALEPMEVLEGLVPEFFGPLVPRTVVVRPGLGRHRESRRNRDPEVGHFRQLAALTAKQVPHYGGAFGMPTTEEVDVFRHRRGPPSSMTKKAL